MNQPEAEDAQLVRHNVFRSDSMIQLAEPPAKPWTAPKNDLPREFVRAVQYFQAHGMADPRGGKFGEAHTILSLAQRGVLIQPSSSDGWIVKRSEGKPVLVAVDGLIYPLASSPHWEDMATCVGRPPDRFSTSAVLKPFERDQEVVIEPRSESIDTESPSSAPTSVQTLPTWRLVAQPHNSPFNLAPPAEMQAAMFLIYGRPDLAKSILGDPSLSREPIFLTMATDLLRAKWLRALDAYARGDDLSAWNLLKDAQALRQEYTQSAAAFLKPSESGGHVQTVVAERFNFLNQVPELISDVQRRLNESSNAAKPEAALLSKIAMLEDYGCPFGRSNPNVSPKIAAARDLLVDLAAKGSAVVPPMIEVVGSDRRLSRCIEETGGDLRVVPVRELALRIVNSVTAASFHRDRDGNYPAASDLRDWWTKNKAANAAERVYRLLADEDGDELQWVFAAKQIAGYLPLQASMSMVERKWALLRLKSHDRPSVTELLRRRIKHALNRSEIEGADVRAKVLCVCLCKWDPKGSLGPAKELTDRLIQFDREPLRQSVRTRLDLRGEPFQGSDPDLPPLLEQRIDSGDASAIPAYRSLLLKFASAPGQRVETFAFYYRHRDEPAFRGLAKQLFLDTAEKNRDSLLSDNPNEAPLAYTAIWSPLMNLPEEQDALIRLLQDKSVIGKASNMPGQRGSVTSKNREIGGPAGGESLGGVRASDTWEVRVCDKVASRLLQRGTDTAYFRTFWTTRQKDSLIASLIETLKRHPKRYWPADYWDY